MTPNYLLFAFVTLSLVGCSNSGGPNVPPIPTGNGDGKADGQCEFDCAENHFGANQCQDGYRCDPDGKCLRKIGESCAPIPTDLTIPAIPTGRYTRYSWEHSSVIGTHTTGTLEEIYVQATAPATAGGLATLFISTLDRPQGCFAPSAEARSFGESAHAKCFSSGCYYELDRPLADGRRAYLGTHPNIPTTIFPSYVTLTYAADGDDPAPNPDDQYLSVDGEAPFCDIACPAPPPSDPPQPPGPDYENLYNTCTIGGPCCFGVCDPDWTPPFGFESPLVLNLKGTTTIEYVGHAVRFYLDTDGSHPADWVAPDFPLLALDLNGDGKINNGRELFGTATFLKDGTKAANGFLALAQYDDNADGVIDAKDMIYDHLRLWFDRNSDGISQPEELVALWTRGVLAIHLDAQDATIGGGSKDSYVHFTATFETANCAPRGLVADVWFPATHECMTCALVGASCGQIDDGCGDTLDCGTCSASGTWCGGGGRPNVCGSRDLYRCRQMQNGNVIATGDIAYDSEAACELDCHNDYGWGTHAVCAPSPY